MALMVFKYSSLVLGSTSSFILWKKMYRMHFLKDSFLRAVIENMDEGVSVCDKDGNLVFMNDTYAHRMNHDKLSYPIPYEQWSQYMEVYEENGKSQIKLEDFPLLRVLRGEEVKQQVSCI